MPNPNLRQWFLSFQNTFNVKDICFPFLQNGNPCSFTFISSPSRPRVCIISVKLVASAIKMIKYLKQGHFLASKFSKQRPLLKGRFWKSHFLKEKVALPQAICYNQKNMNFDSNPCVGYLICLIQWMGVIIPTS